MNSALFISSFVLGIGGSLHCMGMCGPLALSVPYAGGGAWRAVRIGFYYLAKALAYGCLGILPGLLGKGFQLMSWQQGLSIAAGLFMLLLVCLPKLRPAGTFIFGKQFAQLHQRMQAHAKPHHYLLLGFLNGLLPCGLVYTAMAAATVSGSPAGGFVAMFLFGLGTAPALIMLVLFRNRANPALRRRLRPASTVISIAIGLLLIIRGLNLGIPYVSPEFSGQTVKSCCSKH